MSSIRFTGMVSGMDTDSMVSQLLKVQKFKNKRVSDDKTLLTWKQEKWKDLNAKLYKLYTQDLAKLKMQGSYQNKSVATSNDSLASVTASTTAPEGTHTLKIEQLASAQYVTGGKIEATSEGVSINITGNSNLVNDLNFTLGAVFLIGNEEFVVEENSTISSFVSAAKGAGLNASFDETNKRLFISSKVSGVNNGFQLKGKVEENNQLLGKLGLDAVDNSGNRITSNIETFSIVPASDSEVIYNGATLKNNTNVITVNGLTITLKSKSNGETINLNVSNNVQATYEMVKNFVKSYNEILDEMNNLYYADAARGYVPLSDEDKEAMTDDQVIKWETRIKDSILRRDSTLGSLITSMKNVMSSQIPVGESNYSLSNFGIMTSPNYRERGLLHIYGNTEDSTYAFHEDKLMKALTEDPDAVLGTLKGIAGKLYNEMSNKMKSVPNISSALTFYNDKLMNNKQTDYDKQIARLEERLLDMEDRYYQQFSAMETALSRLQSQSSSLLSMLGTSNG